MVSERERRRLVEMCKDEPFYRAAAVVKCAVCLIAFAGVAVVGAQDGEPGTQARMQAQIHESATVAQSRAVYQERKAQYEQRQTALAQRMAPRANDPSGRAADAGGFRHTAVAR